MYIYTYKSPDEWATMKQVCRDELVVYLSFSSHNIYIHTYIYVYVYICICVCVYIYMYIYIYTKTTTHLSVAG